MSDAIGQGLREKAERVQFAALAYLIDEEGPKYLIVTSRRTGRWIFPKGQLEAGEAGWEAAAREAFEEAGVVGEGLPRIIGRYHSLKFRDDWVQPLDIVLHPVRIDRVLKKWDERGERERRFVNAQDAAGLLSQDDMAALCARFDAELQSGIVTSATKKRNSR